METPLCEGFKARDLTDAYEKSHFFSSVSVNMLYVKDPWKAFQCRLGIFLKEKKNPNGRMGLRWCQITYKYVRNCGSGLRIRISVLWTHRCEVELGLFSPHAAAASWPAGFPRQRCAYLDVGLAFGGGRGSVLPAPGTGHFRSPLSCGPAHTPTLFCILSSCEELQRRVAGVLDSREPGSARWRAGGTALWWRSSW